MSSPEQANDTVTSGGALRSIGRTLVRNPHALLLACVVVASLVLRVYVANRCSFWLDEVWTRHDSSAPWPELLRGPSREHPPLLYVLVRLTMDVFGTSDLAVRGVSLFFGCVLLVAVYLLCLELTFSETEALVTVVAVAVAPFFIRHATEARQYALVSACTTLEFVFVLRLLRNPGNFRAFVGMALSAAAAAATHYFGLAYACALIGALAVGTFPHWRAQLVPSRLRSRWAAVSLALALALAAVAFRAVWLALFYRTHSVGPHPHDLPDSILRAFAFFQTRPRGNVVQACVAALGLAVLGFRLRGIARVLPFAVAFPPIGVALLISSGHAVAPRYLAPSWVLYQIGSCAALLAVWRLIRGGNKLWERAARAVVASPIVLVPLAARLAEYPTGFNAGTDYYAGLQSFFANGRGRGTALVVFPLFPGKFIVGEGYPVNAPLIALDEFKEIPGVTRYLVAEFERSSQTPQLEALLQEHFHLSPRRWRALPVVRLAHTQFQRPVKARLLRLTP
ncbi:MAG TPA: glycosyltransferase family 39 protein [Polyangiaceae bacterium]|nr:glycosyltransferase family 39 protein [Polyangiaceae bacterium]